MPPLFVFSPDFHVEIMKNDGDSKKVGRKVLKENEHLLIQNKSFQGVQFASNHGSTYDAAFYARTRALSDEETTLVVAKLQESVQRFKSKSFAYCSMVFMTRTSATTLVRVLTLGKNPVAVYRLDESTNLDLIATNQDAVSEARVAGCLLGTPSLGSNHTKHTFSEHKFQLPRGRIALFGACFYNVGLKKSTLNEDRQVWVNRFVPKKDVYKTNGPSKTVFVADLHELPLNTTTICAVLTGEVDYQATNWAVHAFPKVIAHALGIKEDCNYPKDLKGFDLQVNKATGQVGDGYATRIGSGGFKCVMSTDVNHTCFTSEDLEGKVQVVLTETEYKRERGHVVTLNHCVGPYVNVKEIALSMPTNSQQTCRTRGDFPAVLDECGKLVPQCHTNETKDWLVAFVMEKGERLRVTLSSQVKTDMCIALMILNVCKLIHADVKPENFLMHNNKCKLIDFGFLTKFKDIGEMHKLYVKNQKTRNVNHSSKLLRQTTQQEFVADYFDMYSLCKMLGLNAIKRESTIWTL